VVKPGLELEAGDRARKIDLEVMRIPPQGTDATYYLVLFEEPNATRAKATMLWGNDKLEQN
jgi:hypothetical protein